MEWLHTTKSQKQRIVNSEDQSNSGPDGDKWSRSRMGPGATRDSNTPEECEQEHEVRKGGRCVSTRYATLY